MNDLALGVQEVPRSCSLADTCVLFCCYTVCRVVKARVNVCSFISQRRASTFAGVLVQFGIIATVGARHVFGNCTANQTIGYLRRAWCRQTTQVQVVPRGCGSASSCILRGYFAVCRVVQARISSCFFVGQIWAGGVAGIFVEFGIISTAAASREIFNWVKGTGQTISNLSGALDDLILGVQVVPSGCGSANTCILRGD